MRSGGVTFTASFTLPDGTPLGGEMAPWTGSNAPTVHIVVGHIAGCMLQTKRVVLAAAGPEACCTMAEPTASAGPLDPCNC